MLQVNSLYCEPNTENESPDLYRVLYLSQPDNIVVYIQLGIDKGIPIIGDLNQLHLNLNNGVYQPVANDIWNKLKRSDSAFTPKQIQTRNRAWRKIESITSLPDATQFFGKERGEAIKAAGISKNTAYRLLRRYYQRGQMKNALIPDFNNCGGKGKKRNFTQKPGRWSKQEIEDGQKYGIIIDDQHEATLVEGIGEFYIRRKPPPSLYQAYILTIKKHYRQYVMQEDGTVALEQLPDSQLPTYNQFETLRYKHFGPKQKMIGQEGVKAFKLRGRAITSDTLQQTLAPGSLYEIDATVGDNHLRSTINPEKNAGRYTVYFVVDVFSRMIVGYYIGFYQASWKAGSLALANAINDKVEHCRKYGIEITRDDWPTVGKPAGLIGDNGEFASYHSDNIVDALGIELMNTPPYRGDLKPNVERSFLDLKDNLLSFLPGFVTKREHGDKDYRLDAKLTIHNLNKLVIEFILKRNTTYYMKNYPRSLAMIADEIKPIPINLWRWGMENLGGKLRQENADVIRQNLMMKGQASITGKGIRFNKLYYDSETARTCSWFENARIKGRWKIDVLFDPDDTQTLYRITESVIPEPCPLIDNSANEPYRHLNWHEVKQIQDSSTVMFQRENQNIIKAEVDFHEKIENEIEAATDPELEQKLKSQSNVKRLSGVRENRIEEIAIEKARRNGTADAILSDPKAPLVENPDNTQRIEQLFEYIREPDYTDIIDETVD